VSRLWRLSATGSCRSEVLPPAWTLGKGAVYALPGPERRTGYPHPCNLGRFKRRGWAAARSEWRLIAATHNLLKLHRHTLAAGAVALILGGLDLVRNVFLTTLCHLPCRLVVV
jgi:hypothetical protein